MTHTKTLRFNTCTEFIESIDTLDYEQIGFIVTAVNNHAELVKLSKNFKELIDNCIADKEANKLIKNHYSYMNLEALLAKIEKERG